MIPSITSKVNPKGEPFRFLSLSPRGFRSSNFLSACRFWRLPLPTLWSLVFWSRICFERRCKCLLPFSRVFSSSSSSSSSFIFTRTADCSTQGEEPPAIDNERQSAQGTRVELKEVLKIIQIHEHCIDLLLLVGFLHVTIRRSSNVEADEKQHTAHSQPALCAIMPQLHVCIIYSTTKRALKLEETKHTKKNHASYDHNVTIDSLGWFWGSVSACFFAVKPFLYSQHRSLTQLTQLTQQAIQCNVHCTVEVWSVKCEVVAVTVVCLHLYVHLSALLHFHYCMYNRLCRHNIHHVLAERRSSKWSDYNTYL